MERNAFEIRYDKLGPKVAKELSIRSFDAYYVKTKEEALAKALELIPKGDTVSWGGTVSAAEIGLFDKVKNSPDYKVIDRDTAKNMEERWELMRQALLSDTFLASANAITEDGQLFNIDGNGNRVAAFAFGPKNVIVIAGMNKVVRDEEAAMTRIRRYASCINVQRLNVQGAGCFNGGSCIDCKGQGSICGYIQQIRVCKPAKKIKVILVGEDLGF